MFGHLAYDGTGDMIAMAGIYGSDPDDERNPVIGKLTVAEMVEVLERHGCADADLDRSKTNHANAMRELADMMKDRIGVETILMPFFNVYNQHSDITSAMYVACEPGPGQYATFRLVEKKS